jgi:hypothetical protein
MRNTWQTPSLSNRVCKTNSPNPHSITYPMEQEIPQEGNGSSLQGKPWKIHQAVHSLLDNTQSHSLIQGNREFLDVVHRSIQIAVNSFCISDPNLKRAAYNFFHTDENGYLDVLFWEQHITIKDLWDNQLGGYIKHNQNEAGELKFHIFLNNIFPKESQKYTLLHEMIHGIHLFLELQFGNRFISDADNPWYHTYKTECYARMHTANIMMRDAKNWRDIWDTMWYTTNLWVQLWDDRFYNEWCEDAISIISSRNRIWNKLASSHGSNRTNILNPSWQKIFEQVVEAIDDAFFYLGNHVESRNFVMKLSTITNISDITIQKLFNYLSYPGNFGSNHPAIIYFCKSIQAIQL